MAKKKSASELSPAQKAAQTKKRKKAAKKAVQTRKKNKAVKKRKNKKAAKKAVKTRKWNRVHELAAKGIEALDSGDEAVVRRHLKSIIRMNPPK